ncbi:MAG: hypothetical protein ACKVJE_17180 [Pseudomonadales bacterium]
MKATNLLFKADMVNALLDGRKTQTRRIMKQQPKPFNGVASVSGDFAWPTRFSGASTISCKPTGPTGWIEKEKLCPYGDKGDLIYVRETFRLWSSADECGCESPCECPSNNTPLYRATHKNSEVTWKPSIHMPRWASRLTLKITSVRVEQLQNVSEEDAKAEGIRYHSLYDEWGGVEPHPASTPSLKQWRWYETPQQAFEWLWKSAYSTESWGANPWVWVIEFEVIKANVDTVLKELAA